MRRYSPRTLTNLLVGVRVLRRCYILGMSKLRLLTLVSMLLLVVAVGCSSSDQVSDKTVSPTLAAVFRFGES